jgi:polyisoprenoid-binding protein YceI
MVEVFCDFDNDTGVVMRSTVRRKSHLNFTVKRRWLVATGLLLSLTAVAHSQQQPVILQLDPAKSTAEITLNATLHTVHGKFLPKRGEIRFDPGTRQISGQIVFDAAGGKTGNDGRDHKMHKDVLESAKFPQITFRPDRVEGKIAESGASTAQVHGMFGLHGSEHELTVPVEVRFEGDHWTASAHFSIPYVKWGLKNPSNVFLHVGDSVEVEFRGEGKLGAP